MSFDLSDYVDVAERERQFFERYPEGRIQVDLTDIRRADGEIVAWAAKATVWRDTEDSIPVIDWAVEPVPGKTPYTQDSEAMNASTSAVGRAIVLAGFPSKHIASANEVRARQDAGGQEATAPRQPSPPPASNPAETAQAAYEANRYVPEDAGDPKGVVVHWGGGKFNYKGVAVGDLPESALRFLAEKWDPDNNPKYPAKPEDHRLKLAAQMVLAGETGVVPALSAHDDDIPFAPVPV